MNAQVWSGLTLHSSFIIQHSSFSIQHSSFSISFPSMANRDNHYEAAFEEFLRSRGVPYVAVDEARRSVLADGGSIKSLDFIVSTPSQVTWLVDVKGRRFPSGEEQKQYCQCFAKPRGVSAK